MFQKKNNPGIQLNPINVNVIKYYIYTKMIYIWINNKGGDSVQDSLRNKSSEWLD